MHLLVCIPSHGAQADRLRTQAELQLAQERSRSLAEELSLIRSTLLPLLSSPAATMAAAAGAAPPAQRANGSLAALAQLMQQQRQQQDVVLTGAADGASAAALAGITGSPAAAELSLSSGRHTTYSFSPNGGAAGGPAVTGSDPGLCWQHQSPARANRVHSAVSSPGLSAARSSNCVAFSAQPEAVDVDVRASQEVVRSTPQRGLAGLVSELQADVNKLQQQLHSSRRQLEWEEQHGSHDGGEAGAGVTYTNDVR